MGRVEPVDEESETYDGALNVLPVVSEEDIEICCAIIRYRDSEAIVVNAEEEDTDDLLGWIYIAPKRPPII